jgi:DNA-binding transcriptional MerR regulator
MPAVGDKSSSKSGKSPLAFRTISEVAAELNLPQHVLRFWETKFSSIRPIKRGGGRRFYRPEDIALLINIKNLLHNEGYTIRGVQRLLQRGRGKALEVDQPEVEKEKTSISKSLLKNLLDDLMILKNILNKR